MNDWVSKRFQTQRRFQLEAVTLYLAEEDITICWWNETCLWFKSDSCVAREADTELFTSLHNGCRPVWFSGGGNVNFQWSRITDFLSMNSPKPSSKAAFTSNHNISRMPFWKCVPKDFSCLGKWIRSVRKGILYLLMTVLHCFNVVHSSVADEFLSSSTVKFYLMFMNYGKRSYKILIRSERKGKRKLSFLNNYSLNSWTTSCSTAAN